MHQTSFPPPNGSKVLKIEALSYTRGGVWYAQLETCAQAETVRLLITHGVTIEWFGRVPEQYALDVAKTVVHQKIRPPDTITAPLLAEEGRL